MTVAFKPASPYKHDGQTLHPKLTYALPAGMAEALQAMGFGAVVADPADVDLSSMPWDSSTAKYVEGKPAITPEPMASQAGM